MQENWYAVYTKPHCERKVSLLFTKKRLENFFPLNYIKTQSVLQKKILHEPLFKSYVFVKTTENDITTMVKKVNCMVSLLYWLGKPATINEDEVFAIKEFANHCKEIKLEKLPLNLKSDQPVYNDISYTMDGNVLMIKNRVIKVNLPSLGFTMSAKTEDESIMGREILFNNKEFLVQS